MGFGVVEMRGREMGLLEHGTLRLMGKDETGMPRDYPKRLLAVLEGLRSVIERTKPRAIVVEKIFFGKNAHSALALGQARGVVLVAGAEAGLALHEYSTTEVKQAVTGSGRADKTQVARMLEILFGNQKFSTPDASDALALAVCHALHARFPLTKSRALTENLVR